MATGYGYTAPYGTLRYKQDFRAPSGNSASALLPDGAVGGSTFYGVLVAGITPQNIASASIIPSGFAGGDAGGQFIAKPSPVLVLNVATVLPDGAAGGERD